MLYSNMKKSNTHTYGRWYLDTPELWAVDKDYVCEHPFIEDCNSSWGEKDLNDYNFFTLEVDEIDIKQIFDLRYKNWREKLGTLITWYGNNWMHSGGLWKSSSPLEHLQHLGNFNILSNLGKQWVIFNHGPDKDNNYFELWYYVCQPKSPDTYYTKYKFSYEQF